MAETLVRVVQISSDDGDHKGLYLVYKTGPIEPICEEIREAFTKAAGESDDGDIEDFHSYADELLEKKRIIRIYAEEVYISQFE